MSGTRRKANKGMKMGAFAVMKSGAFAVVKSGRDRQLVFFSAGGGGPRVDPPFAGFKMSGISSTATAVLIHRNIVCRNIL